MRDHDLSSTAVFALMTRATHQTRDGAPRILADPVSLALAQHFEPSLEWAGFQSLSPDFLRAARAAIVLRTRYAEDVLGELAAAGDSQYLSLGAGLDTFAWRQPAWASRLTVFEVDHPAQSGSLSRELVQDPVRSTARPNSAAGLSEVVMDFLPHVIRAEHEEGFRIHLTFNDGTEGSVDFASWLSGPVFEPLKDSAYFRKFFLDGGTVAWPNGADIAPETLYDAARATRSDTRMEPTQR